MIIAIIVAVTLAILLTVYSCARVSSPLSRLEEERELHREIEKIE